MDRRAFIATITGGLLAAPLGGEAQQAGKPYRIGFLSEVIAQTPAVPSFRQRLNDLGYVEGRDFVMEYRWAAGHLDRLPELAADLVRAKVDVILTAGTPGTRAAKQATQTIPIVFSTAQDVVARGIVMSLARPGGNVTGVSAQGMPGKRAQLLKEAVPSVIRVAYLYDPGVHPGEFSASFQQGVLSSAQALNLRFQLIPVSDPNGVAQAFAEIAHDTNGLVVAADGVFVQTAKRTCELALQRRLPVIGQGRLFADAGCLISYGENWPDMYSRAAAVVDRILKGAKPADIPVEQPTKFDLVINLKTARALGLTIPPSLLQRADQVIE
jgi:putative ABC transport system substrate-binding protein